MEVRATASALVGDIAILDVAIAQLAKVIGQGLELAGQPQPLTPAMFSQFCCCTLLLHKDRPNQRQD
jgi:hypothetical protein